jgi:hypothetical protein
MKKLLLVLSLGAVFSAAPSAESGGCFEDLKKCYYDAARRESWVDRWLAGLDCELDFVDCTREKLIGR